MSQPKQMEEEISVEEDGFGSVVLNVQKPMDSAFFSSKLEDSISHWKQQGMKEIRINLPIQHSNLVDSAVKAGFKYYHAELDYLMLGYPISVTNNKREVPKSQDNNFSKDMDDLMPKMLVFSLGLCMVPFSYDIRTSEFKT